jgi:hypothetical protein
VRGVLPVGKPKRGDSISVEEDEEQDEEKESQDLLQNPSPEPINDSNEWNEKKDGQRKPETEKGRWRNFLRRNRQGV